TGFQHRATVDLPEAVRVDSQYFRVARVVGPLGQSEVAVIVEIPTGNLLRVLSQQSSLPARDVQLIQIVPVRITIVQADIENVRLGLGSREELGTHALEIRQGARGRHAGLRIRGQAWIDGIDIEVLVSTDVLYVKEVFRIAAPEIDPHRPCGLRAHGPRGAERLGGFLDPDVASPLEGLEE